MRVAYVAGKYRAKTEWELEQNIRHAEKAEIYLLSKGFAVICPHKNSSRLGGTFPDKVFLDMGLELLRRSDCIYMLDGWEWSEGAKAEYALAKTLGLEIMYEVKK